MNESFDFVVIGSGGGAFCAALVMRAAGKSVIVLEKTDLVGGTTAVSGGVMWIPANRYLAEAGIADSAEQAINYLKAVVGDHEDTPGASPQRRRTYAEQASRMANFLEDQGVRLRRIPVWPDYCSAPGELEEGRTVISELFDLNTLGEWKDRLRPGFLPLPAYLEEAMQLPDMKRSWASRKTLLRVIGRTIGSRLRGKHLVTAGQALQGQMLGAALAAGTEVRTDARVKTLLEEDGRVTGVVVERDGQDWTIGASGGVLINAGGFSRNQRMLDQHIPGASSEWTLTAPGDTGEMIEEAIRIGAAVAQMEERVGNPMALPPDSPEGKPVVVHGDLAKPHSIVVDQSGQRYMREADSYMNVSRNMLAHQRGAGGNASWLVLDSRYLSTYPLAGNMRGNKKPESWFESGFLRRGESIEQLAAACEIDPGALSTTVGRFNELVRAGRDKDFGRGEHVYQNWLGDGLHQPSPTLGTIEQGPFYAMRVYPGDVSTYGGLLTDENAQVLREDGSIIEASTLPVPLLPQSWVVDARAQAPALDPHLPGAIWQPATQQANYRTKYRTACQLASIKRKQHENTTESELFIDGVMRDAEGGKTFDNICPWDAEVAGQAADASAADVEAAIAAARNAFDNTDWSRQHQQRLEIVTRYMALLRDNRERLMDIARIEAGAAVGAACRAHVDFALNGGDDLLKCFEDICWEEGRGQKEENGTISERLVLHEPLGVVGAITPWNVPLYVNIGKVIAALLAGCTVVLKPAPDTPLMGSVMGELAGEAGIPPGVFNVITSQIPAMAGEMLVGDPRVDVISFTGFHCGGQAHHGARRLNLKRISWNWVGNRPDYPGGHGGLRAQGHDVYGCVSTPARAAPCPPVCWYPVAATTRRYRRWRCPMAASPHAGEITRTRNTSWVRSSPSDSGSV